MLRWHPLQTSEHTAPLVAPPTRVQLGNKAAIIRFSSDCTPAFTQFDAAPHPDVRPMKYAGGLMNSMFGF